MCQFVNMVSALEVVADEGGVDEESMVQTSQPYTLDEVINWG